MNNSKYNGCVGFTCGAFDLLHPGHLFFLKECKDKCDFLIVGLQINPNVDRSIKNIPIQTSYERWWQLSSIKWVDEVIPYDTEADLKNMICTLPINVRFLGTDYVGINVTGSDVQDILGITVQYIDRLHDWSSTELRNRIAIGNK